MPHQGTASRYYGYVEFSRRYCFGTNYSMSALDLYLSICPRMKHLMFM